MNLFDLPPDEGREFLEVLAKGQGVRVERIVSRGQASPDGFWYDEAEDEWVCLLSGSAVIGFENGSLTLSAGDCVLIFAHTRHRVERTGASPPCVWLCVFGHFEKNLKEDSPDEAVRPL